MSLGHCRLDEQLKERTATMQENHALFGKLQVFDEARKKTEEHCAGQVQACLLRYQHGHSSLVQSCSHVIWTCDSTLSEQLSILTTRKRQAGPLVY